MFGFFKKKEKYVVEENIVYPNYNEIPSAVQFTNELISYWFKGIDLGIIANHWSINDVMRRLEQVYTSWSDEERLLFDPLKSVPSDDKANSYCKLAIILSNCILFGNMTFTDGVNLFHQIFKNSEVRKNESLQAERFFFGKLIQLSRVLPVYNFISFISHENVKSSFCHYYFTWLEISRDGTWGLWEEVDEDARYNEKFISLILDNAETYPIKTYRVLKEILSDVKVEERGIDIRKLLKNSPQINTFMFLINYSQHGISKDNPYVELASEEELLKFLELCESQYYWDEIVTRKLEIIEDFTNKRVKNNILEAIGETENFEIKKRRM